MAAASPEEYVTETRVRDLQPDFWQAVEEWSASASPTAERLNELVRRWYTGFGPGVTARVLRDPQIDEDILRVTLTVPRGADQARAARAYEKGMVHAQSGSWTARSSSFAKRWTGGRSRPTTIARAHRPRWNSVSSRKPRMHSWRGSDSTLRTGPPSRCSATCTTRRAAQPCQVAARAVAGRT